MKKTSLLLLFILALATGSSACGGLAQPAYAGEISYKIDAHNPMLCTATLTFDFDVVEQLQDDSMTLDWGDGSISVLYAQRILPDSAANLPLGYDKYYRHIYTGDHRYAANGSYRLFVFNQFRSGNITNINGGNTGTVTYYIESQVIVDSTSGFIFKPMQVHPPTVAYAHLQTPFSLPQLIADPDANTDSLVFELVTPMQNAASNVPAYLLPGQVCQSVDFTIDAATGTLTWVHPCEQGIFTIAIRMKKYIQGRLVGSIVRDEVINVLASPATGIAESNTSILTLYPDPASNQLYGTISDRNDANIDAYILAADGSVVRSISIVRGTLHTDIATLASGIYFVKIQKDDTLTYSKFIKQ